MTRYISFTLSKLPIPRKFAPKHTRPPHNSTSHQKKCRSYPPVPLPSLSTLRSSTHSRAYSFAPRLENLSGYSVCHVIIFCVCAGSGFWEFVRDCGWGRGTWIWRVKSFWKAVWGTVGAVLVWTAARAVGITTWSVMEQKPKYRCGRDQAVTDTL